MNKRVEGMTVSSTSGQKNIATLQPAYGRSRHSRSMQAILFPEDMMDRNIAAEIKSRVKMPELLSAYGYKMDRKRRIPCPFHNGVDNNCGVKDEYVHCFVCNESADQIGFVQRIFSLSFPDAIKKIDTDFALGLTGHDDQRKRIASARDAFLRKKEQKNKEAEREMLFSAVLDAEGEVHRLEQIIRRQKPKTTTDALPSEFVEAITNLANAKYRLDCAEEEFLKYETRNG